MTVQTVETPATMAAKTTEPITASDSSDSELEEGEIANDEIEIVEEVIRHPPVTFVTDAKISAQHHRSTSTSTMIQHLQHSSSKRNSDSFANPLLKRLRMEGTSNSNSISGGGNVGGKHDQESKSNSRPVSSRGRPPNLTARGKSPPRSRTRKIHPVVHTKARSNGVQQSKNSSHSYSSIAKRPPSNRRVTITTENFNPSGSTLEKSEPLREVKWVPAFGTSSQCSKETIDNTSSEDDEELGLRLAALHSVVSNSNKPKEVQDETLKPEPSSESPRPDPVQDDIVSAGERLEEDEDEELLRAQLLIEVARKQTKDIEKKATPHHEPAETKVSDVDIAKASRVSVTGPTAKMKTLTQLPVIPKADRLVINLQEDSSDSSEGEDEDDRVVNSIAALLRSARQNVEKTEQRDAASTLQDVSILPRNKQEEYQRLKQELVRRQNIRLQQRQPSPPSSRTAMLTQSQTDNIPKCESPTPNNTTTGRLPSQQSNPASRPVASPTQPISVAVCTVQSMMLPGSQLIPSGPSPSPSTGSSKENQLAKSHGALPTGTAAPPSSAISSSNSALASTSKPVDSALAARTAAIKQQLIRKKQELVTTKEALKNQLELVDKNRALWIKSSQEVGRLKALLQSAEETERQLLGQFTNSQEQTQRLKTKMQTVEKQMEILRRGLGSPRSRRTSVKLRPKLAQSGNKVSTPTIAPFSEHPSASLRVKPKIFVKALAKTSHLTYTRPATAPAPSLTGVQLSHQKVTSTVPEKKSIQYEEPWLYGTLGDNLDGSASDTRFPSWSPNEHASSFANNKLPLDPLVAVCRQHLESASCQDVKCPFQHLPSLEVPHSSGALILECGTKPDSGQV